MAAPAPCCFTLSRVKPLVFQQAATQVKGRSFSGPLVILFKRSGDVDHSDLCKAAQLIGMLGTFEAAKMEHLRRSDRHDSGVHEHSMTVNPGFVRFIQSE